MTKLTKEERNRILNDLDFMSRFLKAKSRRKRNLSEREKFHLVESELALTKLMKHMMFTIFERVI